MPSVDEIRERLAQKLTDHLDGIQCSPYMLSNPTPPSAHVFPAGVEYDQAMGRGLDEWSFTLQVFVGLVNDIGAQVKLDTFLAPYGAQSVKEALETDSTGRATLDGLVASVQVTRCDGYQSYLLEGRGPFLAASWTVVVKAQGKP